jgi:hypothetical protein
MPIWNRPYRPNSNGELSGGGSIGGGVGVDEMARTTADWLREVADQTFGHPFWDSMDPMGDSLMYHLRNNIPVAANMTGFRNDPADTFFGARIKTIAETKAENLGVVTAPGTTGAGVIGGTTGGASLADLIRRDWLPWAAAFLLLLILSRKKRG